jgi:hypothetical protein
MHKQKITSKIRGLKWFAMLLLFLLTLVAQTLPFLAPRVWAADHSHDISASTVDAEWVDSSSISVSSKASGNFPGTSIPRSIINGTYKFQGDQANPETTGSGSDKAKRWVYAGLDFSGACKNNNNYNLKHRQASDDTMRIDAQSAGNAIGYLRIRFNPTPDNADNCYSQDIQVPIGNTTAGTVIGKWLDSANIQTDAIYPAIYQKSGTNPKEFISQAGNQGPCKDILMITGDDTPTGTPVKLYDQTSVDNSRDDVTQKPTISPLDKNCGLAGTVSAFVSNTDQAETAPAGSGLSTADGADVAKSCESSGSGILNWLFCAIIDGVDGTLNAVDGIVNNMLSVDAASIANNPKMYTLWSYFRNIASLLLVVVALVMIISQSLGNS